jgi:PAS domain S-box-containing protein
MKKIILLLCFVVGLVTLGTRVPMAGETGGAGDVLTSPEREWLKAHPVIRLAPDPQFKPIEYFDSNGNYSGIAADYVHLLEGKLGIRFDIVRCVNWDDVITRAKNRDVDVLGNAVTTPQRKQYLLFPTPYLKIPSVIIVRKNVNQELTLDQLNGMQVVMVSGYGYVDLIRNKYPKMAIDLTPDLITALNKVSFGISDAFVGDLATASFYIESEGITNLKMVGETEPPNISGFAVRSDWPELSDILEKGVALLTPEEKTAIFRKWIHLSGEPGVSLKELRDLILIMIGVSVLIILGFLGWNRILKRVVNQQTETLRKEIDERKRAQEALGKSEAHLRTLVKTIPDLVWLKDAEGVYLFCNSRFERFFGKKEELIVGKTDYDFQPRDMADFFRENDLKAIAAGGPRVNEETVTYADDGHTEHLETIKDRKSVV